MPSYPFASVAMDFVCLPEVKLLEIGGKVDYAMVIVCRLTGYILAIPCKQEGLTSHKAAALFLHYCAFFTGIPREIHSDNQSIISSEFFDALCGLAGITRAKSIVYRPQSNGRASRHSSLLSMLCGYTWCSASSTGSMPYHLPCGILMTNRAPSHPTHRTGWFSAGTLSGLARYPP